VESAVESRGLLASLVHPVGCDFVWGLKNVVQTVSAAQLWNYRWLVEHATPRPKNILPTRHGYSVSCCTIDQYATLNCIMAYDLMYRMHTGTTISERSSAV